MVGPERQKRCRFFAAATEPRSKPARPSRPTAPVGGSGGVCLPSHIVKYFDERPKQNEKQLEKGAPIPPNAVVVPGSRPINSKSPWAKEQGLALNCALIIKYRDEKSKVMNHPVERVRQ